MHVTISDAFICSFLCLFIVFIQSDKRGDETRRASRQRHIQYRYSASGYHQELPSRPFLPRFLTQGRDRPDPLRRTRSHDFARVYMARLRLGTTMATLGVNPGLWQRVRGIACVLAITPRFLSRDSVLTRTREFNMQLQEIYSGRRENGVTIRVVVGSFTTHNSRAGSWSPATHYVDIDGIWDITTAS
jgi:hypothetical protein